MAVVHVSMAMQVGIKARKVHDWVCKSSMVMRWRQKQSCKIAQPIVRL